jgi:hypothetical protein
VKISVFVTSESNLHKNCKTPPSTRVINLVPHKGPARHALQPFFFDKVGKGMKLLKVENKPYRALYWDNVNELVERLFLLHASKNAGNDSVHNEIIAIEEELREAGIIK